MEEILKEGSTCIGKRCGFWVGDDSVICQDGTGGCMDAKFITAEESAYHDKQLIEATHAIQNILAGLNAPNGLSLSVLDTGSGLLFAWVRHGKKATDGAVTSDDDSETIAKALQLRIDSHI